MSKILSDRNHLNKKIKDSVVIGIIITIIIYAVLNILFTNILEGKEHEERTVITNTLNQVKSELEYELNSRIYLAKGLEAYIKLRAGINYEDYEVYALHLIKDDPVIRNISLLEGTTIVKAYPPEGNESSIGIDLLKVEDQRNAILETIKNKKTVIDGPVKLVQGGIGVINRAPFYLTDEAGNAKYWGMASIVLDWNDLLKEAHGLGFNEDLDIAIKVISNSLNRENFTWGDESIYSNNPVISKMILENATWEIAAVPKGGWTTYIDYVLPINMISIIMAIVIGYIIATLKYTKDHLKHTMKFDVLTELGNRFYFYESINICVNNSKINESKFGLLFFDIDKFKNINDNYGHLVGDFILEEVGRRLGNSLGKGTEIFRIGGDEFTVLDCNLFEYDEIKNSIERIENSFKEPFIYTKDNIRINVEISIGYAVYPDDAKDGEELILRADNRMYEVKRNKKSI